MQRRQTRLGKENILLAVITLFWFAQYVYIPFQTPYLTAIGISAGLIGTVVGAYGFTQLLLRLPVGVMADIIGKHKVFVFLGVALASAASLIRIIAPDGMGFLAANLVGGAASAMWISYMVLFSEYFSPEEQQKATSRAIMACNLGICLAFVFGTFLYEKTSMAFLCGASAIAGILGMLITLFLIKDVQRPQEDSLKRGNVRTILSVCCNRRLLLFSALALIQQGIQMSTAMSFTTNVLKELGASDGLIGGASVFYMISAVLSAQFASSKFCGRRGARFYIPLIFLLTGLYCVLVPVVGNTYVIFLLQAFPGMSTGILLSYLTSEGMAEVPKEKKSTAMGFFQAVYAIGLTVFPALVGGLIGLGGNITGFCFLAATALFGALISLLYYKRHRE